MADSHQNTGADRPLPLRSAKAELSRLLALQGHDPEQLDGASLSRVFTAFQQFLELRFEGAGAYEFEVEVESSNEEIIFEIYSSAEVLTVAFARLISHFGDVEGEYLGREAVRLELIFPPDKSVLGVMIMPSGDGPAGWAETVKADPGFCTLLETAAAPHMVQLTHDSAD